MSLVVLPTMPGTMTPDGKIILTKRFIEGMAKYRSYWDVPMTVVLEPGGPIEGAFDRVEVEPDSLPFRPEVMSYDDPGFAELLARHEIVLAAITHRQNHIPRVCRAAGVACVFVAEYTLKTHCQIARASTNNPLVLARRIYWHANQERLHRKAIRIADGIQCNGVPCFDGYKRFSRDPLLFFDTRAGDGMLATPEELDARDAYLERGLPLRLLFAGRFLKLKGADWLVRVAIELRKLGVPFEFTLCGGGPLEPRIKADIERHQLGDCMKLAGVLDFITELNPLSRTKIDAFVCCHVQGDPSQTYVDMMAAGVPIAGFANEAMVGISRLSGCNRVAPMYRADLLAREIAGWSADRAALMASSRKAVEFARQHTFDRTFRSRIDHLQRCLEQSRSRASASAPHPAAGVPR